MKGLIDLRPVLLKPGCILLHQSLAYNTCQGTLQLVKFHMSVIHCRNTHTRNQALLVACTHNRQCDCK